MRLLIVVSLASAVVAAQAPVPRYEVKRAAAPPTIDGKLDDAAWGTVPAVTLQFLWESQTGAKQLTRARLLWDAQALYVGFDADDVDITAQYQQRDDPTYRDDAVEIFINPNPQQEVVLRIRDERARRAVRLLELQRPHAVQALRCHRREGRDVPPRVAERSHRHRQRLEPRGHDSMAEFRGVVTSSTERGRGLEGEFQSLGRPRAKPAHEHLARIRRTPSRGRTFRRGSAKSCS
jgi:hypothetical protein